MERPRGFMLCTQCGSCLCVCKCVSVFVGLSGASVWAIGMFGWQGWPRYMATSQPQSHVTVISSPFPSHYSVPLYCSSSTWLEYSSASFASSWLKPTGPCPFIFLISSVRPLQVSVCPLSFLSVWSCITSFFCVYPCAYVCVCVHVANSLGELWLAEWQGIACLIINQRLALLHTALPCHLLEC